MHNHRSFVWVPVLALVAGAVVACSSSETPVEPPPVDAGPSDTGTPDAAVRCGKDSPTKCALGASCAVPADCESANCTNGKCASASCSNKLQDGTETGVDCGGSCPLKCDGDPCVKNEDCQSTTCKPDKTCAPPGTKTCGVGLPNPCENGEACLQDRDCKTDYCRALACNDAPPTVHQDGRRNGGETGVDCGGKAAPEKLCAAGQKCVTSDDCLSTCTSGVCDAPSATDGKQNNGETDVDCGGPNAPKCALTKKCVANGDCRVNACTANVCVEPTDSDGVKNGGETDVDCGGATVTDGAFTYTAPRCVDDRGCAADGDCLSTSCSPAGACVSKSCDTGEVAGIRTCGAKEVGELGTAHESCCRSLPLPTRSSRRLDKYEITAGRMRSFITAVGPNVRAWVASYVAANPGSQLANLLTLAPVVGNLFPASKTGPLNLVAHLGAIDMDNYNGIRGCFNGYDVANPNSGSSGHATYWQPDADLAQYGIPTRVLPRETLDTKPLTCTTSMMLAAFCAWDGGELALLADMQDAWGPDAFPQGPVDPLRPNYNWCNGRPGTGGWSCQDTSLGINGLFYQFPANTNTLRDMSPWIASPGRFQTDVTRLKSGNGEGWYDMLGNLGEYTGDFSSPSLEFCDFSVAPAAGATTCTRNLKPAGSVGTLYTGIPRGGVIGRSWEGHNYGRGTTGGFQVTFQYGKFGGRCVRPAQ